MLNDEIHIENEEEVSEALKEENPLEAEVNEDKEFEEVLDEEEIEVVNEQEELEQKEDLLKAELEELKGEKKVFTSKNKKLSNELDALKDRLLRITAEYENYRKRTDKEKKTIYTDACADVLKNILPVLDNLERALEADGSVEDLKTGIQKTINQFTDSLEKLDVEEVATNEGFDPNMHNAIMHIEDSSYGDNEIVEVFQKGFKRGDKVLRYSLVKVAN
ncbi:nucleotide exchange factor GrpE [Clostridium sp. DL1XJH146]